MKKFLATLALCAVSAVSVFGFTACGDNKTDNPEEEVGESVTSEEWKSAFTATINADNYTMEESISYSTVEKSKDEAGKDVTFSESVNETTEKYVADRKIYSKETMHLKLVDEKTIEKKSIDEHYKEVDGVNLWTSYFDSVEYIQGTPEDDEEEMSEWKADFREFADENAAKEDFKNHYSKVESFEIGFYVSADSDEEKMLVDLYSAFTYSDGKYTATLYIDNDTDTKLDINVEVSIKNGYVIGFAYNYILENNEEDISGKSEAFYRAEYKNYGSTTVTAPEGAVAAINKVKSRYEMNDIVVPQGDEVTAEKWKSSITATLNADNYSMQFSSTLKYKFKNGEEETTETSINSSDIYAAGNESYVNQTTHTKITSDNESEKTYKIEKTYMVAEKRNLFSAKQVSEYKGKFPDDYEERNPEWEAGKIKYYSENEAKEELKTRTFVAGFLLNYDFFASADSKEAKKLVDLYSAFTYSDGKYTATLYSEDQTEMQFEVSFKDGYVVGFEFSWSSEAEYEGGLIMSEGSNIYTFKDYGSTTVTAPEEAVAVLDNIKAGRTVTEDDWRAALKMYCIKGDNPSDIMSQVSGVSFSNFTCTVDGTAWGESAKATVKADYKNNALYIDNIDYAGLVDKFYFWKQDSVICQYSVNEEKKYALDENDVWGNDFRYLIISNAEFYCGGEFFNAVYVIEQFSKFTYDETTQSYSATLKMPDQSGDGKLSTEFTIKFEKSRLKEVTIKNASVDVKYTYEYGTSVTVPDKALNAPISK